MSLPKSLILFVATGAVFLLQLFPLTGIVLMMLMAPFWSIVLVNLGFLGIAAEAATGLVARGWLILPVLWFGGYAGFAATDHWILWQLQREIAAANATVAIPFDPDVEALVLTQDEREGWFVDNYALPVIYTRNAHYPGFGHLATRMVEQEVCAKVRSDPALRAAGIYAFGFHDRGKSAWRGKFETRFCELRQPEDPRLPVVTVDVAEQKTAVRGLPVTQTTTTVTVPGGTRYVLRGGGGAPLPWLPMPVLGCFLNSGAASWDCVAEFDRESFTSLQETGGPERSDGVVLARALGLARVAPADRKGGDPARALAAANAAKQAVVDQETAKLDRALADVSVDIGSVPFNSLRGHMEVILPRLDRIVAAVEEGVEIQGNARNNAQQMFHLIEQAPPEDVAPYRARIDALKDKDGWFVLRAEGG